MGRGYTSTVRVAAILNAALADRSLEALVFVHRGGFAQAHSAALASPFGSEDMASVIRRLAMQTKEVL